jgi:hypothetical protein
VIISTTRGDHQQIISEDLMVYFFSKVDGLVGASPFLDVKMVIIRRATQEVHCTTFFQTPQKEEYLLRLLVFHHFSLE